MSSDEGVEWEQHLHRQGMQPTTERSLVLLFIFRQQSQRNDFPRRSMSFHFHCCAGTLFYFSKSPNMILSVLCHIRNLFGLQVKNLLRLLRSACMHPPNNQVQMIFSDQTKNAELILIDKMDFSFKINDLSRWPQVSSFTSKFGQYAKWKWK